MAPADITIAGTDQPGAKISIAPGCTPAVPSVTAPCGARAAHVIVEVTDNGAPPLTAYRRIIINVQP